MRDMLTPGPSGFDSFLPATLDQSEAEGQWACLASDPGPDTRPPWHRTGDQMIEVRYELEGDIDNHAAERAVERILRYHQHALAGVTCPTHETAPWLTVRGRAVDRLTVTIESCCVALSDKARTRIQDISRRDQE
jgi:hypothetical protein